jgi:integrase
MPRARADLFLLRAKVNEDTEARYRKAVTAFLAWCRHSRVRTRTDGDVDYALCEYIHDLYETNNGKCRQRAQDAVSGIQLFAPQFKRNLPLSQQAMAGWRKLHPAHKHPPVSWSQTIAIAIKLAAWGRWDMGVAALLSFSALLRIGELVALRRSDVYDADASENRLDRAAFSGLRLRRAKTGTNQFAELHDRAVMSLLRLHLHSHSSRNIFDFTADTFRRHFKLACASLGFDPSIVPHSLRHGGATALYMLGVPLETILVRGRWAATKSARHYVQQGRVLLMAQPNPAMVKAAKALGTIVAPHLQTIFTCLRGRPVLRHHRKRKAVTHSLAHQDGPARHSARHDWLVRPNYTALDAGHVAAVF